MDYKETMCYIDKTEKFGSNLGTKRTEKILELLGNPHEKVTCIHIAGTNGKGSTTAMIASILIQAGYKVGMYTSPYIEKFEERIQINGENISKEELADVVTRVSIAVDKVIELGYDHPTQFEIITCAMFLYYYNKKVDFAVIEVGLGGRLDSTNVIVPLVSVITSISYDHMNILGDSIEDIAREKCGIIKKGVPVVLYPQEKEVQDVVEKICLENNSVLHKLNKNSVKSVDNVYNSKYQKFIINTEKDNYKIKLRLLGVHQILNCALAVNVIEQLIKLDVKVQKNHILKGLEDVIWPGRLEIMKNNPMVVLDGAHNIDGIKNLKKSIEKYFKYNKMILILGILKDKQVEDMIKVITPMADKIITLAPHSYRAQKSKALGDIISKYNKNYESLEDYNEAYKKALSLSEKDDLVLICGSLYMIGDMRKVVRNNINK